MELTGNDRIGWYVNGGWIMEHYNNDFFIKNVNQWECEVNTYFHTAISLPNSIHGLVKCNTKWYWNMKQADKFNFVVYEVQISYHHCQ